MRPDRFKAQQLRLNGLPCPEGERLGQSDYYRAITTQYRVLFAPGGRGAAEHKFWEAWLSQCSSPSPCVPSSCTIIQAAAAGTVILTDYTSSQYELLRGLPAIMVEPGAYSRVTPALLERLVGQIARSPSSATSAPPQRGAIHVAPASVQVRPDEGLLPAVGLPPPDGNALLRQPGWPRPWRRIERAARGAAPRDQGAR